MDIVQEENILTINFKTYFKSIKAIYLRTLSNEIKYENEGNIFEIDLSEVVEKFAYDKADKIFLVVENSDGIVHNQKKLNVINKNFEVKNLGYVRRGDRTLFPYITRNGILQFSFKNQLPSSTYFSRRHIDKIQIDQEKVMLEGKFSIKNSQLESSELVIKSRLSTHERKISLPTTTLTDRVKLKSFKFKVDIFNELKEFMKHDFNPEDVVDIFISLKVKEWNEVIMVKVGNPRTLVERFLRGEVTFEDSNVITSLVPYFTLKGKNLSFRIERICKESFETYKEVSSRKLHLPKLKKKRIWVIGEKYYKAQDNGFHFFVYMRTHHPEEEVYYIIDRYSKEAKNVLPYGNVIYYQSPEHFEIMPQADYICTTHHPQLVYPTMNPRYIKKIKAIKVFLQHGVLGTKNLTQINGKQLVDFNVDMFVTSSEREKQIVVRDLMFDAYQVKVTGLSRFDELFRKIKTDDNQILIIPTWRDWIYNKEVLLDSEYLQKFNQLLNSEKLKIMAEEGTKIIFCLHPNMQPYIHYFDIPTYIRGVKQGEVNVQQLIKESQLMITDYSSVGFDFSFLRKPVIYYQFDKDRFLGKLGSHLDLEKELPGELVNSLDEIEDYLDHYSENGYTITKRVENNVVKFNNFLDANNSERIYKAAINFKKRNAVKDIVKFDLISQRLFRRFRRHHKYYDIMSMYNKFISKFAKVDNNLIVFESNVAKSVSDSPKVIYDELKKRNTDYKIVWINNRHFPFDDPNLLSVKRLSPSYFKYISKAKYLINNQNFPHYIKKHRKAIYIQTWHGTPLKKMLNDVEEFQGRDTEYKTRINKAIENWDYLISPSSYATSSFRSAFNYEKKILEVGYPRNDVFYSKASAHIKEKAKIIKQKLGIKDDRKLILYAPTFRDDEVNQAKKHIINLKLDLKYLQEKLGEEYILLLRPHVIISNALYIDESLKDFVINAGAYNDISDLYLISDICITDYSSVMFDYANTGKPMIFFTYDLEHYRDNLRGFYMDFEKEAPGPLVGTNEQLVRSILNIEDVKKDYQLKYSKFIEKYCEFEEGTAAEKVVDIILDEKRR